MIHQTGAVSDWMINLFSSNRSVYRCLPTQKRLRIKIEDQRLQGSLFFHSKVFFQAPEGRNCSIVQLVVSQIRSSHKWIWWVPHDPALGLGNFKAKLISGLFFGTHVMNGMMAWMACLPSKNEWALVIFFCWRPRDLTSHFQNIIHYMWTKKISPI